MNLTDIKVKGLPDNETKMLRDLITVWDKKRKRNKLRLSYYSFKNKLNDFGISIPDKLKDVETLVGWPAMAVDKLAARSRFDGFVFKDEDKETAEIMHGIVKGNRLKTLYKESVYDELLFSCVFLTVSKGKEKEGEPPAIISAYTPLDASALWNRRKKRIKCGMTIIDVERNEQTGTEEPVWLNLYTDDAVWEIKKTKKGWTSRKNGHSMGRPLMEPLVYKPRLNRPFGVSRINRAVMSITDSAMREALRTEVGAEFYTSPQKYILGADEDMLNGKSEWEAYIGALLALTRDENGEVPQVGMFSQGSMQPHTEYMRSLAARFSGETSIPISELGVIHDNPASAEAIYAAKESLVGEAEDLNEINGDALSEIAAMAIALAKGKKLSELDEKERSVMPRFKNPAKPSLVSQADAIIKVVGAIPYVAESDIALEELGFSEEQILRLQSAKAQMEAKKLIAAQMQQPGQGGDRSATMYEMASIIKSFRGGKISRQNAIVLFEQIGIEEDEANAILDDHRPRRRGR